MYYLLVLFCELLVLFFLSRAISKSLSLFLYNYVLAFLFLPGTILHELAHYLMAVILRVKVGSFTLIPQIGKDYIVLGSVGIMQTDPIRRFLVGIAPFLLGNLVLLVSINYFLANNLLSQKLITLLFGYVVFTISNTMFSSAKDMEGAIELFLITAVIIALLYFLGVRIPPIQMNNIPFLDLIQKASYILLIPLGLDLGLLVILKVLQRLKS